MYILSGRDARTGDSVILANSCADEARFPRHAGSISKVVDGADTGEGTERFKEPTVLRDFPHAIRAWAVLETD